MSENQTPNKQNWVWIAAAIAVLAAVICICIAAVVVTAGILGFTTLSPAAPSVQTPPSPIVVEVTAEPAPTIPASPLPPTLAAPDPFPVETSLEALAEAQPPPRDRYDLAARFLGISDPPLPEPVEYRVGDVIPFWVSNDDTGSTVEVMAELVYLNDTVYMWVEQGRSYSLDGVRRSADLFSESTYPTNRAYFGNEASPGLDGGTRLHILHSVELGGGVAGYFFSPHSFPASIVPYSNEKNIFFINIGNTPPGNSYYDSVLAHEFQHMIHYNVDSNEEAWLNEGMSETAAFLNGFGASGFVPLFMLNPDMQLTDWPESGSGANYGSSFLFVMYFLERFGQDALRELAASPLNGMASVDDTLERLGTGSTANDLFVDWTIANLLNDTSITPGIYGYTSLTSLPSPGTAETVSAYPFISDWRTVHQYGADYIPLTQAGTVTITFEGSTQVSLLPVDTCGADGDALAGNCFVWWSNRGDDSNMRLIRAVDLTGVSQAVLEYDIWYAIEELWDFGYLTISTDGGQRWEIIATPYTTTENPHGNSYGSGYTGSSASHPDANPDGWLRETIDLSAYAGQEILIGFEMLTDDAVNLPGLALDNICIEAIGWCDDAETPDPGWEAYGFVRHNNVLPQSFSVQVVVPGAGGSVEVLALPLDDSNRGELTFTVPASQPATLVISGLTPFTTERASYRYQIAPAGQ